MRATAGLDAEDPLRRKRAGLDQNAGVLLSIDVVGDRDDIEWPRKRLQSCSMSAVLPEPTGPPMPTRRGCWLVMIGTVSNIASRDAWRRCRSGTRRSQDR